MKSLLQQGYFVDFRTKGTVAHIFCGPNDSKGGTCPNCNKPLLRFCLLDLTDSAFRQLVFPSRELPLVFCWTCNLAQDRFFYEYKNDEIRILYYRTGGVTNEFPYPNYPAYFPLKRFSLETISVEDDILLRKINEGDYIEFEMRRTKPELTTCKNQIGGQPYLIQKNTDDELHCHNCKEPMRLFASIADDAAHGYKFVDNEDVQVLYFWCAGCQIVGAFQQCD